MAGHLERRVPERHDAIAHVFVDEAARLLDDIGERREEAVDQSGQFLRVEFLGNSGKAADIGKQDREVAHAAAEREKFGMATQLVDHDRWHVAAERIPYEPFSCSVLR